MRTACRFLLAFTLFATGLCVPARCHAWGAAGHGFITEGAIRELPAPLRTFFELYVGQLRGIASTEPSGTHFIDIDSYPEFFTHTFPRDLSVLSAQYGSTVVNQNGTAPWTAVNHYEALRTQFTLARGPSDWVALLSSAGALAHYLEDLHNPMHLTVNHDGRLTGQTGLHGRYESTLIGYRLAVGLRLTTNLTDCVFYPSMRDALFDEIDLIYTHNAALLAADSAAYAAAGERTSTNYYQRLWDAGCSSFTPVVMQRAAAMVASAWYSAWREAGFPQPPGVGTSSLATLRCLSHDNTAFRLAIDGDAGQRLDLQTSTDLTHWVSQATFTNLDGRIEITTPPVGQSAQRYYRAIPVP